MSPKDAWGLVMALAVVLAPLFLAWGLLAWNERQRKPGSAAARRRRP